MQAEHLALVPLRDEARALVAQSRKLTAVPATTEIADRLEALCWPSVQNTPYSIALLGGAGVGKTRLFNLLLEEAGVPPLADGHASPVAATALEHHRVLSRLLGVSARAVAMARGDIVLVDTPALDSLDQTDRTAACTVLDQCDLAVLIVSPDKRGDQEWRQAVMPWIRSRPWLFVLNKADLAAEQEKALRQSWLAHLEALGFRDPRPYLTSAIDPARFDGVRLKQTLLRPMPPETAALARTAARLRAYSQAVSPERLQPVRELAARLEREEQACVQRLRQTWRFALEEERARHFAGRFLHAAAWRHLARSVKGLAVAAVWLQMVCSQFKLTWDLCALDLDGSPWRNLPTVTGRFLRALLRTRLPLQRVLGAFKSEHDIRLLAVAHDAIRITEDLGLRKLDKGVKGSASGRWNLRGAKETAFLDAAGAVAGRYTRELLSWWHQFLANLAPVLLLLHIAHQLLSRGFFLLLQSSLFYWYVLVLGLFSLLPGHQLLRSLVAGALGPEAWREIAKALEQPCETAPLREWSRRLRAYLERVDHFRRTLDEARETLVRLAAEPMDGVMAVEKE